MTSPISVTGAWRRGWVLDAHIISSTFVGYDSTGREQFETQRSQLGELLYQLKYKGRTQAADEIAAAMAALLNQIPNLHSRVGVIVPTPPSSSTRPVQPVLEIVKRLSQRMGIRLESTAVSKIRDTPQLKNVQNSDERREILDGAFEGRPEVVKGHGVLLVDDLYRSGATANAVTLALLRAQADFVCFIAATYTRRV